MSPVMITHVQSAGPIGAVTKPDGRMNTSPQSYERRPSIPEGPTMACMISPWLMPSSGPPCGPESTNALTSMERPHAAGVFRMSAGSPLKNSRPGDGEIEYILLPIKSRASYRGAPM
eukprot:100335-Rhodomonas_salina.2